MIKHDRSLTCDQTYSCCSCWTEWPNGIKHPNLYFDSFSYPVASTVTWLLWHYFFYCFFSQSQIPSGKLQAAIFERTKYFTMFGQCCSNFIKPSHTRSNKVSKQDTVGSPNSVWSCLIGEHFPFGLGLCEMCALNCKEKSVVDNTIDHWFIPWPWSKAKNITPTLNIP